MVDPHLSCQKIHKLGAYPIFSPKKSPQVIQSSWLIRISEYISWLLASSFQEESYGLSKVNLSFFLVFPFLSHQSWTPGMSVRPRRSATVTARGEKGGRWRDGGRCENRRHGAQLLGRGGCHASATQQTNGWQLINGDTMEIRKISQTHIINYVYIYMCVCVCMYVYIYIYMCMRVIYIYIV